MKQRITAYTFDASAQTVTFSDYTTIALDAILLITNVTDQIIIYNFADTAKGGTVAGTNVLTLEHDTTSMADTDDLQIFYDEADGDNVRDIVTREYMTTDVQTDDPIVDSIASGTIVVVTAIAAVLANSTSVDVQFRIGFGTANVPSEPASGASVAGMVLSHPGCAAGSGLVGVAAKGVVATGGNGQELRITNDVPTGGKLTVMVSYYTITT